MAEGKEAARERQSVEVDERQETAKEELSSSLIGGRESGNLLLCGFS
jgi:hypothetical protein